MGAMQALLTSSFLFWKRTMDVHSEFLREAANASCLVVDPQRIAIGGYLYVVFRVS